MTLAYRAIVRRIGAGGLAAAALIAVSACGSSQAAACRSARRTNAISRPPTRVGTNAAGLRAPLWRAVAIGTLARMSTAGVGIETAGGATNAAQAGRKLLVPLALTQFVASFAGSN